jgi:signal transduction histidine kinase
MGAAIGLALLSVVLRFVHPGPVRNGLIMLVVSAFAYNLADGLARLLAAAGEENAATAWFAVRFFGLAFVPAALYHLAGASSGLLHRPWFLPTLALVYTGSLVAILGRVGTESIIQDVEVVNLTLRTTPGPLYSAFAVYGLLMSLAASVVFLRYARTAPTTAARSGARIKGVAAIAPFGAGFANFFLTGLGTSPTFDPIGPFLVVAAIVFAALALGQEIPATTLGAIRTIFGSLPDGVVVADRRGLVVLANPAAAAALGVKAEALEGEPLRAVLSRAALPPAARDRLFELVSRVESGAAGRSSIPLEIPGPPSRALLAVVGIAETGMALPGARPGDPQRDRFLFIAIHEETEARSREVMLARTNEVKDLFISIIGHDLKAPLSAIAGYGELIALDANAAPDGLAVYRYAQSILGSARQIQLMMENARLYSRLVDPHDILRARENLDLAGLIQKEAAALKQAAERRRVTVTISVDGGAAGTVVSGAPILRSVFQNLIDNAIKYTAEESQVALRLAREGATAVVEVEDQGPGIPADKREAIFRRFTRLEQTRSKAEGLGLGLAIARQITELHGGSLDALPRRDGRPGARFVVRLPLNAAGPSPAEGRRKERE